MSAVHSVKSSESNLMEKIKELRQLIHALTDVANAGHIGAQMQIIQAQIEIAEIERIQASQTELSL